MKYEIIGSSSKGNCIVVEEWKPIQNYEEHYEVSNLGNVRNKITKYLFIPQKRGNYLKVSLSNNGKKKQVSIHRLVAKAFLNKNDFKYMPNENKEKIDISKLEINHINENKYDNRASNLEWCSRKYNLYYGKCIEKISISKHKQIKQYDLQDNFIKTWGSIKEASIKLKIPQSSISKCVCGTRRKTHNYKFRYANESR